MWAPCRERKRASERENMQCVFACVLTYNHHHHHHPGIKESDTGLAPPSMWDLAGDKQMNAEEHPLQVARVTKIIDAGKDDAKYMINIKQVQTDKNKPTPARHSI